MKVMKEQLISFETAKLAKEKGFDWKVISCYRDGYNYKQDLVIGGSLYNMNSLEEQSLWKCKLYSAPTQSLLQKWLREKNNIDVCIYKEKFNTYSASFGFDESTNNELTEDCYKTYEEALEEGLYKALKLINDSRN